MSIRLSQEVEITFVLQVKLNQLQITNQLIELFKNDDIFQYELNTTMMGARGREEEGSGVAVTKEAFTIFFTEFFSLCTVGRTAKCHLLGAIFLKLNGVLWSLFW